MIPINDKNDTKKVLEQKLLESEGWITFGWFYIGDRKTVHFIAKGTLQALCRGVKLSPTEYRRIHQYFKLEDSDNRQDQYCKKCLTSMPYYERFGKPSWL